MAEQTGGWWCCCGGCWDFVDNFTDPPSAFGAKCRTAIGEHWEDISPGSNPSTWTIESVLSDEYCALTEAGNPGATIINTDRVPIGPLNEETGSVWSRFMSASISPMDFHVGDTHSILLDYVENDDSTVSYLEFRYHSASGGQETLGLYYINHGVEEDLMDSPCVLTEAFTEGITVSLSACVSKGKFYGAAAPGGVVLADAPVIAENAEDPGWRAGIMHQQSRETQYIGWRLQQLIDDESTCPSCGTCSCIDVATEENPNPTPKEPLSVVLTATIIGYDDCENLSGITVELGPSTNCAAAASSFWSGYVNDDSCLAPYYLDENQHVWGMTLYCREPGPEEEHATPENWDLTLNDSVSPEPFACGCVNSGPQLQVQSSAESTCDPFMLIFDVEYTIDNTNGESVLYGWCYGACDPCGGHNDGFGCTEVYPGESKTVKFRIVITE